MSTIQKLRSIRIANIAVFDFVVAVVGLYFVLKYLKPNKTVEYYRKWTLILVFPISIITHLVLGIPTMLNYYLGLSPKPMD